MALWWFETSVLVDAGGFFGHMMYSTPWKINGWNPKMEVDVDGR